VGESHFPFDIEHWAAESVQGQPDQRALMMSHSMRAQMRFGLFVAALAVIALLSLALECIRHWAGGVDISVWRWLWGMLPALLGLVAMLVVLAAFVRDVYSIPGWRPALGYAWLLLFGRAPLSLLDSLQRTIQRLFSALGLSPPRAVSSAPYPHLVVQEGRIGEKYEDTPLARFGGPGSVVVFNDSAVFIERFGRFIRVAGPGAVFLRRFELIREVLDLRPQERSEEVKALTKDGIPVKTEVQVRFQLPRPPTSPSSSSPDTLDPIYERAWTRAGQCHIWLAIPEMGLQRESHWPERVMGNVGSTMRTIVANCRLDELLEPYEPDRDPHHKIARKLQSKLAATASNFGVQVLEVRMGALEPMLEKVQRERMDTWRVAWKSQARVEKAIGEAEAIRQQGLARAYAQMEIVLTLTREFQELVKRDATLSAEFIALRFIEALRQTWARPGGMIMSSDAIRILDYLQQMVRRDYTLPRGDASGG